MHRRICTATCQAIFELRASDISNLNLEYSAFYHSLVVKKPPFQLTSSHITAIETNTAPMNYQMHFLAWYTCYIFNSTWRLLGSYIQFVQKNFGTWLGSVAPDSKIPFRSSNITPSVSLPDPCALLLTGAWAPSLLSMRSILGLSLWR